MGLVQLPETVPITVITGATGHLGGALVDVCAQEGHFIVPVGRNSEKLEAVVARALLVGARGVSAIQADITQSSGLDALFSAIDQLRGGSRYLFNNAGEYLGDDALQNQDAYEALFEVKINSPKLLLSGAPWDGVLYSGSQAQVVSLPNSTIYGDFNARGSAAHIRARAGGINAKVMILGNIKSATSDRFNLAPHDVIRTRDAAMLMLGTMKDPTVAVRIVLPNPSGYHEASAYDRTQTTTVLVDEIGADIDTIVTQYNAFVAQRFASLTLPPVG